MPPLTIELQHKCKDGSIIWGEILSKQEFDAKGNIIGYHGITREITKRKELQEKIEQLAYCDTLTKLPNRRSLDDKMSFIMSKSERSQKYCALVFLDLDNFKPLNDTYGHECGDVVLSTFGKILNKSVREHDIVGRYGGEEFVAIIHFNLNRELLQFLKRIKTIVTENSFLYKEKKIKVTFSAGVAIRSSFDTYENTLQKADMLLYQAKENGRNKIILENGMEI